MRRTPPDAGFALIEALVTLALVGMAAVLLAAGVAMAARMTARGAAAGGADDEVVAAQMLLRTRIEALRAVGDPRSAPDDIGVRGTPVAFEFVGEPPDRVAPDALWRYRLARTIGGDLVLFASGTLADANRGGAGTAMRLVGGTAAIAVRYFGSAAGGGGRGWQARWSGRQQPPELVRIAVAFPPGDRRRWPDLVIRPRVTTNAACRIDAGSGRCAAGA